MNGRVSCVSYVPKRHERTDRPFFLGYTYFIRDHYLDTYLKNHDIWTLKIKHRSLTKVPHEILQNAFTEFYNGSISRQTAQNGSDILYS